MDTKILLGKILQRFADIKSAKIEDYNSFGYIRETNNTVFVSHEGGEDTPVPFEKILLGIEAYKGNPNLYNEGPSKLRELGITHITSPIWTLLHLLNIQEYK